MAGLLKSNNAQLEQSLDNKLASMWTMTQKSMTELGTRIDNVRDSSKAATDSLERRVETIADQVEKNRQALETSMQNAQSLLPPPAGSHWRADHIVVGGWLDTDSAESRVDMAAKILKLLGASYAELYMTPYTPRKYNCSIVKVKCRDEAAAANFAFAMGIQFRDARQEVLAMVGTRKLWSSVERPPQVGQRRRALKTAMEWANKNVRGRWTMALVQSCSAGSRCW